MDPSQALALRSLLESQQVASLATLHKGKPAVSMVPYALLPRGRGLVIHVSALAAHTADMLADPAVALLVTASATTSPSPLELPRASVQGETRQMTSASPEYSQARGLYISRFPESEQMFSFSDFSLFVIEVHSIRFVGGFAQARSVTAEQFASIMSGT